MIDPYDDLSHVSRATSLDDCGGFSLLELITVMGILAVLSGIGIGFLGKSESSVSITWAVLRDKIRLAHETARTSGRPTTVEMIQSEDGSRVLRGKTLAVVGQWHLEADERPFADLVPELRGVIDQDGRFGACMRPDADQEESLFSLSTAGIARFDLIDGFAMQVEVFLDVRDKCVVVTMDSGNTFHLELDEDLVPMARMHLSVGGGQRGRSVELVAKDHALPLSRWVTLGIYHDGREFALTVGNEVVARSPAKGEPYQNRQGGLFEISPRGSLVPGKIDEIQLLAYERGEPVLLSNDVDIAGLDQPVLFDRAGNLLAPVTIQVSLGELKESRTVAPGGVLK